MNYGDISVGVDGRLWGTVEKEENKMNREH